MNDEQNQCYKDDGFEVCVLDLLVTINQNIAQLESYVRDFLVSEGFQFVKESIDTDDDNILN